MVDPIFVENYLTTHNLLQFYNKMSIGYYYLDLVQLRWYRYGQPGTQVNLNSDIVSAERIPVPSIEEQRKIVTFFSAIDQKINVTEKQLSSIKSFKKGLLQQMFV